MAMRLILVALAALAFSFAATAAVVVFSLDPVDGAVTGSPGSTVGWGYSLSHDDPDRWLATIAVEASPFQNGMPDLLFDFPVLGPLQGVTVPYDPAIPAGLYQLTWDATAPVGAIDSGTFTLLSQWWTGDPLDGGVYIEDAPALEAAYSASAAGVPEPSTVLLAGLGLILCACRLRRRN